MLVTAELDIVYNTQYMTETKSVGHSQVKTRCVAAAMCSKGYFVPRPLICWTNGEPQRGEGGRRLELTEQEAIWPVLTFSEPVPITSLRSYPGITFITPLTFSPIA